jgi:hypothetical protein
MTTYTTSSMTWIKGSQIGKGSQAKIFDIKPKENNSSLNIDMNKKYVVKELDDRNNYSVLFEKNIKMHKKFQNANATVRLVDHELYHDDQLNIYHGIMIMEKRDKTFSQYIHDLYKQTDSIQLVTDKTNEAFNITLNLVINLLTNFRLCHDDLNIDNIMINMKDQYDFCDLVLIDFENTLELDSYVVISQKMLDDIHNDLKSTFDLLLTNVKRSKFSTPKPPTAPKKKTSTRSRSPSKTITFSENKKKRMSFNLDDMDNMEYKNEEPSNLLKGMPFIEFSRL